MIKEYLEHYKMDYTMSVYLPEVAMQGQQHAVPRDELAAKAGINMTDKAKPPAEQTPLLVQMLQQMRLGGGAAKAGGAAGAAARSPPEEKKGQSNTSKSPFRSSNVVGSASKSGGKSGHGIEEDIDEDIVQDPDDIQLHSAHDPIAASGGASSVAGVDQSIDTLRMEEFDYLEEVKYTPRGTSGIDDLGKL